MKTRSLIKLIIENNMFNEKLILDLEDRLYTRQNINMCYSMNENYYIYKEKNIYIKKKIYIFQDWVNVIYIM